MKVGEIKIISVLLAMTVALMALTFTCVGKEMSDGVKQCLISIEDKMSDVSTIQTKFVQKKDLALFNQQIVIKGSLYLEKPSVIAWHIDSPLKQTIILNNTIIKQWDEDTNKVQKISLAKDTSFSVAAEQIKVWVCGSYLSLADEYDIQIIQIEPIGIKFTPLEDSMANSIINSITVIFQKDVKYIEEIIIKEKNGDTMSLAFFDTLINIDIDPSVWKVNSDDR